MTPIRYCEEHRVRYYEYGCPQCKIHSERENRITREMSIKKTKNGLTWPLSKSEKKA